MVDLSFIFQEHNESAAFVRKMITQTTKVPIRSEVIYVTSMRQQDFYNKFGPFEVPVTIIGNVQSCGEARNQGGRRATGKTLLYMDSHVCFRPDMVTRLLDTLNRHQNAIVAPAVQAIEFPSCIPDKRTGGIGHGVYFRFNAGKGIPFEWVWEPAQQTQEEFTVPFVCGCAFAMRKDLFSILDKHGGFLSGHQGLSWEEEITFRLWRLGYPTYIEPRAVFGHLYKGYADHPQWDQHSTSGYYTTRTIGFYINVFNKDLWDHIEGMLIRSWGNEYFKNLEYAKKNFTWLRNLMAQRRDAIDERWFLRTE